MKNIAMKCNQQQFDAIKPKLIGFKLEIIKTFDNYTYLVNNLDGKFGVIASLSTLCAYDHNRKVFEEWNEEIFLQYCGIEFVLPERWCIKITKDNIEFCKSLKNKELGFLQHYNYTLNAYYSPIKAENGCIGTQFLSGRIEITFEQFKTHVLKQTKMKTLPKYFAIKADVRNPLWKKYIKWLNETYNRSLTGYITVDFYGFDGKAGNCTSINSFHNNPEILTLQQWDEIINKPMQNLTIHVHQLLDILKTIQRSCSWFEKARNYLIRVDENQNITFTQQELNEGFKAANTLQKQLLEQYFGKQLEPIQWDKIKTGSKVMIVYSANFHCSGFENIDKSKAVEVIFYKANHGISLEKKFFKKAYHDNYCTFYQNGNFVLFSADTNTDYITEVIQY